MYIEQSPFATNRINQQLAQRDAGICTDCGLEDADTTRFDGMFCKGCADSLLHLWNGNWAEKE